MKPARKIISKLRDKYRLVILNDKTFEEKASVRLSRLNVSILLSTAIVLFASVIGSLIFFTPIKEYIPGYADVNLRRELVRLHLAVDSLEIAASQQDLLLSNIKNVMVGNVLDDKDSLPTPDVGIRYDVGILDGAAPFDSILRMQMERDYVELRLGVQNEKRSLAGVTFFRPVEGQLIQPFSSRDQNYGIGLLLSKEEGIKATLDGSVVFAGYSISDKYFVCIQHANNMISWYKKMNRSLKSQGEFVRAGEVIGISGGEASGTEAINFEFQIWYNGNALDPADFLNF